jgi:predicted nucleotidyltransferase
MHRLLPLSFSSKMCKIECMKRDQVIRLLSERRNELASKYSVKSLALFGSVARDEATVTSDVDMLVEFDRPVGYFGLFALQDHLELLLGCKVDLGTPGSLKPRIRERVMGECVRVA